MKKLLLILLSLILTFSAFSQKVSQKNADALFEKKSYLEAAAMYAQLKESHNNLKNLGDCYYNNSQMVYASRYYGKLFLNYKDSIKPEYYFKYAHALLGSKDIPQADVIMGEYLKFPVNTPKFIASLNNNVPHNYVLTPISKVITNGDFGATFWNNKIVFASTRSGQGKAFGWNGKPYLDLFIGDIDETGALTNVVPFSNEINSKTHESSPTFSSDGKTMYFSRTNDKKVKVGNEKVANVKIFKAELVGKKWTNIKPLSFCSDEYSFMHPSLSKDGKKLYFCSDMPGSLGSFDIFVVDVLENNTFGIPQNLGNTINTIHLEQFPFISEDGTTLYFASNGLQGMGGMDIFMSKAYQDVFSKPLNMGETINSNLDDFAYVLDEKTGKGYISTNRNGNDNIYSFTRSENMSRFVVEGEVKDKNSQQPLPGTIVTLYDENDKLIAQMVVGADADYVFSTEPNKKYRVEAIKDLYIPHSEVFTTNEDGKLRYTIEMFMECYDDAEEIITKRDDGKVLIELENIYFEWNKWELTPDSQRILDVLVNLLKKYPHMHIELGAHTDSRASEMYNMILSNKRASSALEYLVKNGINRKRLKYKGYGETMPLVKCEPCTEEQHAINRRCEFIILK